MSEPTDSNPDILSTVRAAVERLFSASLAPFREEMAALKEDHLAEMAAMNAGVVALFNTLLVHSGDAERRALLSFIHDAGLKGVRETRYWSVAADRRDAVVAKAEARWSDLVTSIMGREYADGGADA